MSMSQRVQIHMCEAENQTIDAEEKLKNCKRPAFVPSDLSSHIINPFTFQVTWVLNSSNANLLDFT